MSTYSLTEDDTKKLLVLSLFISYAQLFFVSHHVSICFLKY